MSPMPRTFDVPFAASAAIRWENPPRRSGTSISAASRGVAPEITAAMAPLDPRLGEGSEGLGIEYLLKNVTVQHVFPMHMWKKYEVIDRYIAAHPDEKGIIARITRDGQQFEI